MPESGLGKDEKRKFNMLLKVVERLVPRPTINERVSVTDLGTVREPNASGTSNDSNTEGRWL